MSFVTYSININGERRGFVRPTRGIRQEDPLSPYMLLLSSEGFTNLLEKKVERERKITGMKICRQGPTITHLFFC